MRSTTPVLENPFAAVAQHLSHSQVNMFDKCQLQWFLKYVKGIQKPPTVHMLLGQAYHAALAHNFNQKTVTGADLPVKDILQCFHSTFEQAIREGRVAPVPNKDFDSYRDPVAKLLTHYYEEYVKDKMEPLLVEHELTIAVPGIERQFVGIIDLQMSDGRMIDFKISSRKWQDSERTENMQATAYAMLYGIEVDFEFHIGLRANKNPAIQILRMRRAQDDVDNYIRHLQDVVAKMKDLEEDNTDPVPYTGFCSEKTCQYWQECRDWRCGYRG
jgi:CRISPR/Cas system-associated exonuclease Cas4 (RecB family)